MPGPLLHLGATVLCSHGGQALPGAPNPRVLVSGQPVATMAAPYTVVGCPFVPPASGPCVLAQWVVAATRVLVAGQPAVLFDSQAICTPTGTPLMAVASQVRVVGS
jgi:hypothetical protein